jgi:hypothetical protein
MQSMKANTRVVPFAIVAHPPEIELELPMDFDETPYAVSVDYFYYSGDFDI